MSQLQPLADLFSVFHDADISSWTGDKSNLTLTLECVYLAERIDPSFERFYLTLYEVDFLQFMPWTMPLEAPAVVKTALKDVFEAELEILSAAVQEEYVVVTCKRYNPGFNNQGGNLSVSCKGFTLLDQQQRVLTLRDIQTLAKGYWDAFGKQ
jgi:hypothetical protein